MAEVVSVDTIYPIVVGIVQGVSEFLPVSSSAHLIITSEVFSGRVMPLSLNIALHLGTLAAVVVYFWRDWYQLVVGCLQSVRQFELNQQSRLLMLLIIGSIPAGLVGLLLKNQIEDYLHHIYAVIFPLAVVGILMWWVDRRSPQKKSIVDLTLGNSILIGVAQAFALFPGTSRSGITIMAARWLSLSRVESARYSFLLGTPAMFGAAVLEARELISHAGESTFFIGTIVSFGTGLIAIRLLLEVFNRVGFGVFALYRLILAISLFLYLT